MPIIRSSRVLYRWLLPVAFGVLVFKLSVWCGAEGYVSGLRAAAAAVKIQRLWPDLNPRTWVPEASMLTTRPPKPSSK